MKKIIYMFAAVITSGALLTSCGSKQKAEKGEIKTETVKEDDKKEEDAEIVLDKKMKTYFDVLEEVSAPLQDGYNSYIDDVDSETGEPKHTVYMGSEIKDFELFLDSMLNASKKAPKADVDQYAESYASKAKTAIAIHNELRQYYDTKENLTDKNAKGLEKHKAYMTAISEFKAVSKLINDAYQKWYKDGNAKYIAKLEKKGDKIRVAANKLMNITDEINDAFYKAFTASTKSYTPELEAVMEKTKDLQTQMNDYISTVKNISDTELKSFFSSDYKGNLDRFGTQANYYLGHLRQVLEAIQKKNMYEADSYTKDVKKDYKDLIDLFNDNKF